jgi:hypothetical protein
MVLSLHPMTIIQTGNDLISAIRESTKIKQEVLCSSSISTESILEMISFLCEEPVVRFSDGLLEIHATTFVGQEFGLYIRVPNWAPQQQQQ